MLQSKLKINRTTWGLSVPYRRPSHQPPHFLPSVSLHYYCKSFIYLLCSHTCKGTAVEVKWTCLLKTGTSIFCRFLGGGLHQWQAAGAWQLAGWQFGVSSLFMAQLGWGHSWEVGRKRSGGTAWVADNGGQKPRSGLREDRTAELQGVSI